MRVNFSIVSRAKEGKTLSNHCELWQRMSPGSVYSTTVHCSPVLISNHSHCVPCPGVFMKPRRTAPGESNNSTFILSRTQSCQSHSTLHRSSLILATERAWITPFRGNAHLVLLETIADLLDKNKYHDARLASIVNSSGTGKSRMVDQLGKKIITVPMCLCPEKTKGFYVLLVRFSVLIIRP